MRVLTLFGTRPEIIRLSQIIKHLDPLCDQMLVHTGQNYDPKLSDVFFADLGLRAPDVYLCAQSSDFAEQVSQILVRAAQVFARVNPDRVLVLGDTNSGLAAIVAARMGIPVYHLEAGNRCYDDRVPEEINRRLIDHCSHVLMPYTQRSKENLMREGIERQRIFVVGNPIYEVLTAHDAAIASSTVLQQLGLRPQEYFAATFHRAENVDEPARLGELLRSLTSIAHDYRQPVVVSLHPRTADKMRRGGLSRDVEGLRLIDPLGFADFVMLERSARAVITDSGTVQEECCLLGVANVTIRDVTERAETIEAGSGILSGVRAEDVRRAVAVALASRLDWTPPSEYLEKHVSQTVAKVVLGYCEMGAQARASQEKCVPATNVSGSGPHACRPAVAAQTDGA
ncbi:MAG: non-hydrolyzing UDP-N-acetylglucosamine 2-epimerase [Anaerolineae bacterium]